MPTTSNRQRWQNGNENWTVIYNLSLPINSTWLFRFLKLYSYFYMYIAKRGTGPTKMCSHRLSHPLGRTPSSDLLLPGGPPWLPAEQRREVHLEGPVESPVDWCRRTLHLRRTRSGKRNLNNNVFIRLTHNCTNKHCNYKIPLMITQ